MLFAVSNGYLCKIFNAQIIVVTLLHKNGGRVVFANHIQGCFRFSNGLGGFCIILPMAPLRGGFKYLLGFLSASSGAFTGILVQTWGYARQTSLNTHLFPVCDLSKFTT